MANSVENGDISSNSEPLGFSLDVMYLSDFIFSGMSKLSQIIYIHWSLRSLLKHMEHEFVLSFNYLNVL